MSFGRAAQRSDVQGSWKMKRIRKQVYDLELEDLEKFPVWEFALDEEDKRGQDEATLRPFAGAVPIDPAGGMYVVRSNFWFADGTHATGYLTPQIPAFAKIGYFQPTIITLKGQVGFWFGGVRPTDDAVKKAYQLLGRGAGDVFPVRYESAVELKGGPVSGVITGFMSYRSFDDRTIVETN
jgi:hypothetical protein